MIMIPHEASIEVYEPGGVALELRVLNMVWHITLRFMVLTFTRKVCKHIGLLGPMFEDWVRMVQGFGVAVICGRVWDVRWEWLSVRISSATTSMRGLS